MDIVIIDYGMGNLRNVQKALEHIGVPARISSQPADLQEADGLVLPGVGAFGDAMINLGDAGLIDPIRTAVSTGKPLLGICLGLQLLFEESEEMGLHRGLGLLPGRVIRFAEGKVPHIGWNQLWLARDDQRQAKLLDGIADGSYAYFVHSYYAVPADARYVLATTDYSIEFASVVGMDNVWGVQPHPEKSQEIGLKLLRNWSQMVRERANEEELR